MPQIYIGESECVGDRLPSHDNERASDILHLACIITSCDGNLTKAHIAYIEESGLISVARAAGATCVLKCPESYPAYLPEVDMDI